MLGPILKLYTIQSKEYFLLPSHSHEMASLHMNLDHFILAFSSSKLKLGFCVDSQKNEGGKFEYFIHIIQKPNTKLIYKNSTNFLSPLLPFLVG